jgi:hypothetical protein
MTITDVQDKAEAPPSDAGGVAARQGFKYQDHVAAFFVLTMIEDSRLTAVECETADDITLRWSDGKAKHSEFVQVKTTDSDRKWTQAEILQRPMQKSQPRLRRSRFFAMSKATDRCFASCHVAM